MEVKAADTDRDVQRIYPGPNGTVWALTSIHTAQEGVTAERTRTEEIALGVETVTLDFQNFLDGDPVANISGEWTLEAPVVADIGSGLLDAACPWL